MKPDICMFCRGKLSKGFDNFIVKINDHIVEFTEVPAWICDKCGEAYFDDHIVTQIDKIGNEIRQDNFLAHPIAAGSVNLKEYISVNE